jgi:exopolyphosphatase/guanosine-5'-triphosphate,3'-diphosphate pyrophosphatase
MRIAVVDIGTNSFLCLVCDVSQASDARAGGANSANGSSGDSAVRDDGEHGNNNALKVISDICKVVRLGEKVHANRAFLPEALTRAESAFSEFSEIIAQHNVNHIIGIATSAARDVSNGAELIKLGMKYKIPIKIIDGETEALMSYAGACSAFPHESKKLNILVVDVGGGSTELIYKDVNTKELKAQSFDVGCVRLTEMFFKNDPVETQELNALSKFASKTLSSFGRVKSELVVAVSGTPTTLACIAQKIDFNPDLVEGYSFTRSSLEQLTQNLSQKTLKEKENLKGLDPLRADVIVAGGALLIAALDIANASQLMVSTRGLRYGVALNFRDFT